MKKSFPVNIEGQIYYFDDDAYERLNNYYRNLRLTFVDADGAEIVADIESRIAEILADEHADDRTRVVTLSQVDALITRMGRPEQLKEAATDKAETDTSSHRTTPPPYNPPAAPVVTGRRRLFRDIDNKVIGGVLSGLAHYWGTSVTALRILAVILAIFTWFWPTVIVYIIAWLLIPAAVTPRQRLEMEGKEVSVDNIGYSTINTRDNSYPAKHGGFGRALARVLGVCIMGFLGLICCTVAIAMIVLLIYCIAGYTTYIGFNSMEFVTSPQHPLLSITALLLLSFAWLIPAIAGIWASCCTLFKVKGAGKRTVIIVAIIEFILIIATIVLFTLLKHYGLHPSDLHYPI